MYLYDLDVLAIGARYFIFEDILSRIANKNECHSDSVSKLRYVGEAKERCTSQAIIWSIRCVN